MARFRAQVFKNLDFSDREWSNTYLIEADDLTAAEAAATVLGPLEVMLHGSQVLISRIRVSDIVVDTDVFSVVVVNLHGTAFVMATEDWLPLFNTVRVDIGVAGGGRPSRKYYRPPIQEEAQLRGILNTTYTDLFTGVVGDMISEVSTAGGQLVDPDGQAWINPAAQSKVQMRQLHRKRKKTVTP